MTGGLFEGIFTHAETPGERRARREKVMRSAETLARGMRPEAGQKLLDETELALYGRLDDGMETRGE